MLLVVYFIGIDVAFERVFVNLDKVFAKAVGGNLKAHAACVACGVVNVTKAYF